MTQVLFEPFPKQEQFLAALFTPGVSVASYGGGIRGGKTFAGLGGLLLLSKKYPMSRWAIVRKDLQTIKKNTYPSFYKICPSSYIRHVNNDTNIVTFTNGSQFIFFGENYAEDKELNRWKGLEVNGFLLEEANELQEVSFYKAIERRGSYQPPPGFEKAPPLIITTCNPSQNWYKRLIYDPYQHGTLPEGWVFIPALVTDNPIFANDETYMASLRELPRWQYEVFVNGNWEFKMMTGGEVYKGFDIERHVGRYDYDPTLPLHISWDDNSNPYLPMGIFQVKGSEIRMIDEIAGRNPNNTIAAVCREFARRYNDHQAGLYVYGDATAEKQDTKVEKGRTFYRIVMEHLARFRPQLRVPASNPSVVMRVDFINTILERNYGGITFGIDERCKLTIQDLMSVKEAADGTKNKEMETDPISKVRYQKYGHFSDIVDYFICRAFHETYANFMRGGAPLRVSTGRNVSKNIM